VEAAYAGKINVSNVDDVVGLKVVELNQQWEQLWFPQQAAA